jgi:hypothetical protein
MPSLKPAARALLIVLAFAALTVVVAVAVDSPLLLHLYAKRFAFLPGPWFAEHLERSAGDSAEDCLVIGASTAREAFDPTVLDVIVPGTRFVNAATTGGNNEVFEVQAQTIARYGLKYRCIILGMQPWVMFHKTAAGKPGVELISTEYVSNLRLWDVLSLTDRPWREFEWPMLMTALAVPLEKHAGQLNRIVRYGMYLVYTTLIDHASSVARYERYPGELVPSRDYNYPATVNYLREDRAKVISWVQPYNKPEQYGHEEQTRSLARTLDLLSRHATTLFVVNMPDTTLADAPNAMGSPAYNAVLERFHDRLTLIDCRAGDMGEEFFLDFTHVNVRGRALMSESVGRLLKARLIDGATQFVAGPCRMGS